MCKFDQSGDAARVVVCAGQLLVSVIVGANNDAFPRIGPKRRDDVPEGVDTLFCHRAQVSLLAWVEPRGKVRRNGVRLFGYRRASEFKFMMNVGCDTVQIVGMRAISRKECLG